jgi:threonine/homoserine/homoserine lactone efflux protein
MFRSILGFAIFAVVALVAIKLVLVLFGVAISVAMMLLVWAAFGVLIYLGLRLISPGTADKVRQLIAGRRADM